MSDKEKESLRHYIENLEKFRKLRKYDQIKVINELKKELKKYE